MSKSDALIQIETDKIGSKLPGPPDFRIKGNNVCHTIMSFDNQQYAKLWHASWEKSPMVYPIAKRQRPLESRGVAVLQHVKRQRLQTFRPYAMYIGKSEKIENSNIHIYGGSIPK